MACSTPEDKPKQQSNAAPAFQLFPTTNMWTFIKLDTRNGRMWQVQYDIQGDDRMEVVLNENYLAGNDSAGNGRFTLYSTKNMYTFILLDQHDGRMWQVQWAIDADQRLVIPINPTQNSTNL
jgi:hypothetical protein